MLDQVIALVDDGLRTVLTPAPRPQQPSPAASHVEATLDAGERLLSARLMRVNHSGEICAQALYRGGGFAAQSPEIRAKMEQAAAEEGDHLAWTEARLRALDARTSILNPLWYTGAFLIGALAGAVGDKWSLGFVAETERQVVAHLDEHLTRVPPKDVPSRAILEQMRSDEGRHGTRAVLAGAAELPTPIKGLMRLASRVMTRTAYWF